MRPPHVDAQSLEPWHVQVICPYCGHPHTHLRRGAADGTTIHRAPGCGLIRTADQRRAGYLITLTKPDPDALKGRQNPTNTKENPR